VKIGNCEIKNRIIMAAMGSGRLIVNGKFRYQAAQYLIERARGGVGLLIPGVTYAQDMKGYEYPVYKDRDVFIPNAINLMEKIHGYGAKLFMQLGVGRGRVLYTHRSIPGPEGPVILEKALIAPSAVPNQRKPEIIHRPMTIEEIETLVYNYGQAAKMARESGIDGIEVHAAHEGYLLDQFMMECTNQRADRYGGSLENRMRLAKELIEEVHRQCGKDYPVMMRYSVASKMRGFNQGALPGEHFKEFGRSLEESPEIARMLESYGYAALDADNGSHDSWYWAHPPAYMPRACNLPEVEYIKHFVNIPVFCGGRMDDFDIGADAVASGRIDGIAVARQFLADPEWPSKLKAGKIEEIRPCISCQNGCFSDNYGKEGRLLRCTVNATVLREEQTRIVPVEEKEKKRVVIIGGGLAGMEVARVATMRGHQCIIFEKSGELGGVFIPASRHDYKDADRNFLEWHKRQIKQLGIDVRLNTEATMERVQAERPDIIVAATGATERKLSIPGGERAISAVEALMERKLIGKEVVVIGGGLTGCEIAFDLSKNGKKVTVVEVREDIIMIPGLCEANEMMLRELLRYHEVRLMCSCKIKEITEHGVIVGTHEGAEIFISADTVILSIGYEPYLPPIVDSVKSIAPVKVIGDASEVANLLSAINNGYDLALLI